MEVQELGHLVLYVRNVERSATFYRDVLGWRQILPTENDRTPRRLPRRRLLGALGTDPSRAAPHRGG